MSRNRIAVLTFGDISPEVIEEVHTGIHYLDLEPLEGENYPVPEDCIERRRNQLNAGCLINRVREKAPQTLALGITDYDLYAEGLNFIFGQAELRGQAAVISVYRLIENRQGCLTPLEKRRIRTETVHELGHVFGLEHCDDPYCAMYFSSNLMDTDRKGDRFCAVCLNLYARFRRML